MTYPGNAHHQALLQRIVEYYQDDPRILAVIVFGSLGRGNWDDLSDFDLDIIVEDGVEIDLIPEITRLCAIFADIPDELALVIPDDKEEADLVLASLAMLSIRYHPLATTKPAILDSMLALFSRVELEAIRAAGLANLPSEEIPLDQLLDQLIYHAIVSNVYAQRGSFWVAMELFHRMRGLLMEIFSRTHGGERPLQTFQAVAPLPLQTRLQETISLAAPDTLPAILQRFVYILENDLPALSAGQLALSNAQQRMLARIQ